jgi:SRSO17 transposase
MLPMNHVWKEGRMTDLIETAPKRDLAIQAIEQRVEALRAYHAIYRPLMQRREPREAAHPYLQGLLAPLPRQSIEPMVRAIEGIAPTAVRAMQACISAGTWQDARRLHQPWHEVETDVGAHDGVLMVDGSDVPKPGTQAVGVKRQYGGELGQRATCQAGVLVGYVSRPGDTVLDRRLSAPVEWLTDDAYAERRMPCGIPAARPFKTTPALAQEMLAALMQPQAPPSR